MALALVALAQMRRNERKNEINRILKLEEAASELGEPVVAAINFYHRFGFSFSLFAYILALLFKVAQQNLGTQKILSE